MEIILSKRQFELQAYSKAEYASEMQTAQSDIVRVLSSYETSNQNYEYEDAKQQVYDLTTDVIIEDYLDARFYVLRNKIDNSPVSFAIYTHDTNREGWHLEYICTHAEYTGNGLGEILLRESAKDLMHRGVTEITSIVEKRNAQSIAMHYAFANNNNVKFVKDDLDEDRYEFSMYISKIEQKPKEEAPEFN